MMKCVAIILSFLWLVNSQRPPYAGSSNRYPIVLPQFLEGQGAAAGGTLANRIDLESGNNVSSLSGTLATSKPAAAAAPPGSSIPADLPVDALGDIDLINRIKTWPKEKQPFWFLNWQQIQEHRGDANNRGQTPQTQPNPRPTFAG